MAEKDEDFPNFAIDLFSAQQEQQTIKQAKSQPTTRFPTLSEKDLDKIVSERHSDKKKKHH